jgi:hypothetical protein
MTCKQLIESILAGGLTAQGMTPAQVLDCLKYVAGTSAPAASTGK